MDATPAADSPLPRSLVWVLAASAGLTVANLYYNQPLLVSIATSFGAEPSQVSFIPTLTQLGYGAGMLTLVPLGDRIERRSVIVVMTALSGLALSAVAWAPTLPILSALSFFLGIASMVPQAIVPYAAAGARPSERGRVVGTVMSGLLIGILLSRTASGAIGARFGWRTVYAIGAVVMFALSILLRAVLPRQQPEQHISFRELYASLFSLLRDQPVLRECSIFGALSFACFSVFWSTLAFHLAAPPHHYGSAVVGLYGIVGVTGALAAPLVGRFSDKRDPRVLSGFAFAALILSFAVFYLLRDSLLGIALGVVLLDVAAQANHITSQTRIYALAGELRNRLNTIYMSSYFAGGALGSWLGATAFGRWGWLGVCGVGAVLSTLGLLLFALSSSKPRTS